MSGELSYDGFLIVKSSPMPTSGMKMDVFPNELWPKSAEVGILGLGYPEEFGGVSEGIDLWYSIILNEEMSRVAVGGLGATLMVHGIGLPPVINFGSDEIKKMVAPPVLAWFKAYITSNH
jgi:acyl-CoA dehydrogenase